MVLVDDVTLVAIFVVIGPAARFHMKNQNINTITRCPASLASLSTHTEQHSPTIKKIKDYRLVSDNLFFLFSVVLKISVRMKSLNVKRSI